MQICHFDGSAGTFGSLIAELTTGSFPGLLEIVDRKDAKRHRRHSAGVKDCGALGGLLADIVEMGGIAPDYATDNNNSIGIITLQDKCGYIHQFHRTGHTDTSYVFLSYTGPEQSVHSPVAQGMCNFGIPFRGNDMEFKAIRSRGRNLKSHPLSIEDRRHYLAFLRRFFTPEAMRR